MFSKLVLAAGIFSIYYIGLIIYRLFFSPLSKFPGPRIAAFSFG
jgi:hypothetical protein